MPFGEALTGGELRVPSLREWVVEWVVMFGVGIGLAALGPFGSFELSVK